jgi:hypothetical protein
MARRKKKKQCVSEDAPSEESFDADLAAILMAKGMVASPEEALCLAETIVTEIEESDLSRKEACISAFGDYFSMSRDDAKAALSSLMRFEDDSNSEGAKAELEDDSLEDWSEEEDTDYADGEYIGEGECELCERTIRLTKHHLIPRSTWPRMFARLTNAAEALANAIISLGNTTSESGLYKVCKLEIMIRKVILE